MLDHIVYHTVPWQRAVPKVMINSFPKAGTHMAEQMIKVIASPVRNFLVPHAWVGNIGGNGFWNVENQQVGQRGACERMSMCMPGQYYKAHMVWSELHQNFLDTCGYGMVFMYRDLRDVAVSWAHHILNTDGSTLHPDKKMFHMINMEQGFGGVLEAVIEGVGPLPGVIEHWEDFAGWLDADWVLPVKFEDMRNKPEETAKKIAFYLVDRTCEVRDDTLRLSERAEEIFEEMADATRDREKSLTFRKGKVGGWKDEFTYEAGKLFVEHGGQDWLVKLGYEDGND